MTVCRKCNIEMRVEKNGVVLTSVACNGEPGSIRRADLWKCPECGVEVVPIPDNDPEMHWNHPAFASRLRSYELDPREVVIPYFANPREKALAAEVTTFANATGEPHEPLYRRQS